MKNEAGRAGITQYKHYVDKYGQSKAEDIVNSNFHGQPWYNVVVGGKLDL